MTRLKTLYIFLLFQQISVSLSAQFSVDGGVGYIPFDRATQIEGASYNVNLAYSITPRYKLSLNSIYTPNTQKVSFYKNVISTALLFSPNNVIADEKFSLEPALGIEHTFVDTSIKGNRKSYLFFATNINLLYTIAPKWRIGLKTHSSISKNKMWSRTYNGVVVRYHI